MCFQLFFLLQINKMNGVLLSLTVFVCLCGSTARYPWRPTTWSTPRVASWTWTTWWLTWWRTETRWDILSPSFPGFIFTSCLAGRPTGATECPMNKGFVNRLLVLSLLVQASTYWILNSKYRIEYRRTREMLRKCSHCAHIWSLKREVVVNRFLMLRQRVGFSKWSFIRK